MNKKPFICLISISILIRIVLAVIFPLTADELNFWNYFHEYPKFSEFWQFFTKYDTQQPLFHLLWFPFYQADFSVLALRAPSILVSVGSFYVWNKLFNYEDEENSIPWVLFLFVPFVSLYSMFFLPYSLLILTSLVNFYSFKELDKSSNKKNLSFFILSSVLISYTHYFGALQAVLLSLLFAFFQKNKKLKLALLATVLLISILLVTTTDFLNDLKLVNPFRGPIHPIDILGYFNLLLGGKYVALTLGAILIYKKKWITLKNINVIIIFAVVMIAYLKSILISPSFEARYLLILIYPIYSLMRGFQFKYSVPLFFTLCLISLYILYNAYGPAFVTDYKKITKDGIKTGLLISPCPKFYFREDNYICKYKIHTREELREGIEKMIVSTRNMEFARKQDLFDKCQDIGQDLSSCTLK